MNKLYSVSVEFHVECYVCKKDFINVRQLQDHQGITNGAKRLKCGISNDGFLHYSSYCRYTRRENCNKKLLPQENMILCKGYLECRKKFKASQTPKGHFNKFHETKNMIVKDVVRYLSIAHQSTITKQDEVRKYSEI